MIIMMIIMNRRRMSRKERNFQEKVLKVKKDD